MVFPVSTIALAIPTVLKQIPKQQKPQTEAEKLLQKALESLNRG